jgi:hypothetical protein
VDADVLPVVVVVGVVVVYEALRCAVRTSGESGVRLRTRDGSSPAPPPDVVAVVVAR